MPYMLLQNTFTRPTTDIPFRDINGTSETAFIQSLKDNGTLWNRWEETSEDQLSITINNVFYMESYGDAMLVNTNIRIDPGWYDIHVATEEHCSAHGVVRSNIIRTLCNDDFDPIEIYIYIPIDVF